MGFSHAPTPSYRSLMIFIDGGYLRKNVDNLDDKYNIIYQNFTRWLAERTGSGRIQSELVRAYYYDAIVDQTDSNFISQSKYFDEIQKLPNMDIRLGRLIKTEKKYRQKGVDILLAIDVLSKAYLNHFDWCIILAGDDDYLDLVRTVKNTTGKQVIGAYFKKTVSERLVKSFDRMIVLTKEQLIEGNCIKTEYIT